MLPGGRLFGLFRGFCSGLHPAKSVSPQEIMVAAPPSIFESFESKLLIGDFVGDLPFWIILFEGKYFMVNFGVSEG